MAQKTIAAMKRGNRRMSSQKDVWGLEKNRAKMTRLTHVYRKGNNAIRFPKLMVDLK